MLVTVPTARWLAATSLHTGAARVSIVLRFQFVPAGSLSHGIGVPMACSLGFGA